MSKNEVMQHRNSSHQIFLTTLALLITLGNNKTDYYMELIFLMSFVYNVVIFSNMYRELVLVYKRKNLSLRLMLKNQLTLILPISFLATIFFTFLKPIGSVCYILIIVSIWYLELILLYYLVGRENE